MKDKRFMRFIESQEAQRKQDIKYRTAAIIMLMAWIGIAASVIIAVVFHT